MESVVTWVALVWVSGVAIVDEVYGGAFGLIGFLAIGPFIAASFATPRRTALVGLYATVFSLVLSTPPRQYGQLWSARRATGPERRRRVAAETAQRMQAMARALTTAADPAQVADAVFAALRDELQVDAATCALLSDSGQLRTLHRFGYDPHEPIDGVLTSLRPDGPVLGQNV